MRLKVLKYNAYARYPDICKIEAKRWRADTVIGVY
jgi:hypothetical protein